MDAGTLETLVRQVNTLQDRLDQAVERCEDWGGVAPKEVDIDLQLLKRSRADMDGFVNQLYEIRTHGHHASKKGDQLCSLMLARERLALRLTASLPSMTVERDVLQQALDFMRTDSDTESDPGARYDYDADSVDIDDSLFDRSVERAPVPARNSKHKTASTQHSSVHHASYGGVQMQMRAMDSDRLDDDSDSPDGGHDWITLASDDTQSQLDSMAWSQQGTPSGQVSTTTPTKARSRMATPMGGQAGDATPPPPASAGYRSAPRTPNSRGVAGGAAAAGVLEHLVRTPPPLITKSGGGGRTPEGAARVTPRAAAVTSVARAGVVLVKSLSPAVAGARSSAVSPSSSLKQRLNFDDSQQQQQQQQPAKRSLDLTALLDANQSAVADMAAEAELVPQRSATPTTPPTMVITSGDAPLRVAAVKLDHSDADVCSRKKAAELTSEGSTAHHPTPLPVSRDGGGNLLMRLMAAPLRAASEVAAAAARTTTVVAATPLLMTRLVAEQTVVPIARHLVIPPLQLLAAAVSLPLNAAAAPLRALGVSRPARLALLSAVVTVGMPDLTQLPRLTTAAVASLDTPRKRRASFVRACKGARSAAAAARDKAEDVASVVGTASATVAAKAVAAGGRTARTVRRSSVAAGGKAAYAGGHVGKVFGQASLQAGGKAAAASGRLARCVGIASARAGIKTATAGGRAAQALSRLSVKAGAKAMEAGGNAAVVAGKAGLKVSRKAAVVAGEAGLRAGAAVGSAAKARLTAANSHGSVSAAGAAAARPPSGSAAALLAAAPIKLPVTRVMGWVREHTRGEGKLSVLAGRG